MRNVVRYSRPKALSIFPEVDDFFRSFGNLYSMTDRQVPLEMYEEGNELVVKLDAPGVDPKDVEIRVFPDRLGIRAQAASETSTEDSASRTYHCTKRRRSFEYTLALPVEVDTEQVQSSFENGVISLRVAKREKNGARVIRFDN